ncbi:MAG: Maf family protein [Defluviitaleaceae bacterium]|nr:Maf family protein [Defluviitaleaceae bacterium]
MKIILASGSPRRRELLDMAGFSFEVIPANVDETADPALSPDQLVTALSEKKAYHIQESLKEDAIIIGADTIVAIDGLILGKPDNKDDAFDMLMRLQGRPHTVFTGVTVLCLNNQKLKQKTFVESTKVFMRSLSQEEINDYIATGEPFDKAGAYGIQEKGALLIERVEGDYFTVVGLPLCRLGMVLKSMMSGR